MDDPDEWREKSKVQVQRGGLSSKFKVYQGFIDLQSSCPDSHCAGGFAKTKIKECHSCRTDYYFQNGACIDMCSTGYYLDGTDCFQCQIGCIECWEADECVECEAGFYLQENQCVTECSYGYAKVDEGNLCLPCRTGCEICSGPTQQENV